MSEEKLSDCKCVYCGFIQKVPAVPTRENFSLYTCPCQQKPENNKFLSWWVCPICHLEGRWTYKTIEICNNCKPKGPKILCTFKGQPFAPQFNPNIPFAEFDRLTSKKSEAVV